MQIKVIMYRKCMHLKISEEKERRGEYVQDVVRILWRELQKVDRMQVLGFLVALVIPNAVIQGILSSSFVKMLSRIFVKSIWLIKLAIEYC